MTFTIRPAVPLMGAALALVLAATAAPEASAAKRRVDWEAWITHVKGSVELRVRSKDGRGVRRVARVKKDTPLERGDRILTGPGGAVEIAFRSDSALKIGPDSDLVLSSVRPANTVLGLNMGSLVAKIKLFGKRRFRVKTPTAVAAVRGTEFAVETTRAKKTARTRVGVFDEGRVSVRGRKGRERVLSKRQELEVRRGVAGAARALKSLKRHRATLGQLRSRLKFIGRQFKRYSRQNRTVLRRELYRGAEELRRGGEHLRGQGEMMRDMGRRLGIQDMIDAADEMDDGADEMDDGADEMEEGAEEADREMEEAEREMDEGLEEADEGLDEAEREMEDAQGEIDDAMDEVNEAMGVLDDLGFDKKKRRRRKKRRRNRRRYYDD